MSAQRERRLTLMRKSEAIDGWHSRGYLPHFDGPETPQFVTFRLGDSLPQSMLEKWRIELKQESDSNRDVELRRRIETYLDQGHGACYLRDPRVAKLAQDSLLFFDSERYSLSSRVIMPNHVHILITPFPGHKLSRILQSLKSYIANEANTILDRRGQFWQQESFDRYIRNLKHWNSVVQYIENNPVKAGLCKSPEDWPFSSAWFRARQPQ
jgi:REP element-mobilizing transposase RayT